MIVETDRSIVQGVFTRHTSSGAYTALFQLLLLLLLLLFHSPSCYDTQSDRPFMTSFYACILLLLFF